MNECVVEGKKRSRLILIIFPEKVKGSLPFHFYFFWLDVGDIGKYYITNRNYKQL